MNGSCSPITSFLASPDILPYAYHTFTIIGTPLHIIAFYCIIKKSTAKMKSVRGVLLQLHCFTVIFDTTINFLCAPYVASPCLMGWVKGVLSWFGVSTAFQAFIILTSGGMLGYSTLLLFEYRYFTVVPVNNFWKKCRIPFHIINFIIHLAHLTPQFLFLLPKDQKASLATCPYFPCGMEIPENAHSIAENIWYNVIAIVFLVAIDFPIATFCSLSLNLYIKRHKSQSAVTKTLQRKLQRGLMIQCITPSGWIAAPMMLAVYYFIQDVHSPAVYNSITIVLGSHGIVATSTMLLVHASYRNFLFGWIFKLVKSETGNEQNSNNATSSVAPVRPLVVD